MKKAERKRPSLVANLGDLNRPFRVRFARYLGREWWAIDSEDVWPGMVMDLRRLGFEAMAVENEVLVREGAPALETQMEGPAQPSGLKPFPTVHPTIQIQNQSASARYSDLQYLDEYDEELDEEDDDSGDEDGDELEPDDLDDEEN
jgi:hypothetical protein